MHRSLQPSLEQLLEDEFPGVKAGRKAAARAMLEKGEWMKFLCAYFDSHLLDGFQTLAPAMSDPEYWWILRNIWVNHDTPHLDLDTWRRLFCSSRPERLHLMKPEERQRLKELPEQVQVFRGFQVNGGEDGLAWSLTKDIAVGFGSGKVHSYKGGQLDAFLATALIPRARILGYFPDREDEVIIADLRGIPSVVEAIGGGR